MRKKNSNDENTINYWPSLTDVSFITIFILILFIFVQVITNTDSFAVQKIKEKQLEMQELIINAAGEEFKNDIQFSNQLSIQKVQFSNGVLFNTNSADLQDNGKKLMLAVGNVLREHQELFIELRIEGHTDAVSIKGGPFKSNWELSSARATEVVKFFDENVGINPNSVRMSAVGFSQFVPIDNRDTADAKAKNRRIELAIYYDAK